MSPRRFDPTDERFCRVCGCTDDNACVNEKTGEACHWVEADLCSACVGKHRRRPEQPFSVPMLGLSTAVGRLI